MMPLDRNFVRFSTRDIDSDFYQLLHTYGNERRVVGTFYKNTPLPVLFDEVKKYHAQLRKEAK